MSTYRNSIAAFLVYFQSTFAATLEDLSSVGHSADFKQENFVTIQPTFKAIAQAMKRDTLGLEEQEKYCRMYRQLVSDYDKNEAEKRNGCSRCLSRRLGLFWTMGCPS